MTSDEFEHSACLLLCIEDIRDADEALRARVFEHLEMFVREWVYYSRQSQKCRRLASFTPSDEQKMHFGAKEYIRKCPAVHEH